MSRQLNCTYLKVAAALNRTPDTARSRPKARPGENDTRTPTLNLAGLPALSFSIAQEIDNLELMHQFSTDTYKSLCVSESELAIWQVSIPRLALKHLYLMDGLLALASLHLASSSGANEAFTYQGRAIQYYNRSLAPFRQAIDNLTPQNCDAVFAHSVIMIAISVASPRMTALKDEASSIVENIVVLFELLQGVKKILFSSKPWIQLDLFTQGEFWQSSTAKLDDDTNEALLNLVSLSDKFVIGSNAKNHRADQEALAHLRHCFSKFIHSPDPSPVLAWLARVDKDFVESLKRREPYSLLILVYWGVLLGELDKLVWWARGSGRALVTELIDTLWSRDPQWERALSWAKRKMSLDLPKEGHVEKNS